MKTIFTAITAIMFFSFCLSAVVFGQRARLEGNVYEIANGREVPVAGVRVIAPGGQSKETDSKGHFVIDFQNSVQPGQATRIEVNRPGWLVRDPLFGECATQNSARNFELLKVIIVPKGSPLALEPKQLSKVVARWADERVKLRGQMTELGRQLDEYAFLREYAEKYGVTLDQFKAGADEWAKIKESGDKEERALKEYWLKNYDSAAALAREAALGADEELERATKGRLEAGRKVIRRFQFEGNAWFARYKFREALAAYNEIEERFLARKLSKDDLPEEWADTKILLGNAESELGIRVEGLESQSLLGKAVAAYREALKVYTREQSPQDWAMTQNCLGDVLTKLFDRASGDDRAKYIREATAAFRAALEVYTRRSFPHEWAMTQNNLGNMLTRLGERVSEAEGTKYLRDATTAFRASLEIYIREQAPEQWAATQNNLGNALQRQGERLSGEAAMLFLAEAVAAYRDALKVYTLEGFSQQWAMTQNNLGSALRSQGERTTDEEIAVRLLGEAVTAYRNALKVYTLEQLPQRWAATQNNLGNALQRQGERTTDGDVAVLFLAAVAAYRNALKVYTLEQLPQQWAMAQYNLGVAFSRLGQRVSGAEGTKYLHEAVEAYRATLKVYGREQLPNDWAMTQNNLAKALFALQDWSGAAEAYANVLTIYPDNKEGYQRLSQIYQERLFKFPEAFELNRLWLEGHPDDFSAETGFVEKHFTTGRFTECQGRIAKLLASPLITASNEAVLRAIGIAALLALDKTNQVPTELDALLKYIGSQPADFKVDWNSTSIIYFIGQKDKLKARHAWLQRLFDALQSEGRDKMLKTLREVKVEFKP